ncbi:trans-aconitate methyltransferase [Rhodomicrobium udaipurense JA643]|uniref:Trans-aconitate 2-methyltransferase n=1 Tax=Rhodomicrobium udaipurense TaxID=1202716 RepID=A0A8I1GI08_9HYPH|nr:trans-aconitate 2-methyltransferase [Rhodomicrobium udaipurense]KAI96401.1 trans-aconitate methyltransferase [Rhodomicrobium udaipurense JA643]MBJ7544531.1 trans-aconitate 2-methyltransferase [Rhodomicrobium udaipurense]
MPWSSEQYLKFEDQRTRPARDLLNAVPAEVIARAADLGCGPGNSTELIAGRFPEADIVGVDSSSDMLDAAKKRLPGVKFRFGRIEEWSEPGPWDLIYANASLQWVGQHERLLPRLAERLSDGGSLAVQMPDNLAEPSHASLRTVAATPAYVAKLGKAIKLRSPLPRAEWYYKLLKPYASRVDIWRTTYLHVMPSHDAIVEWVKGTGARPFLKPLDEDEQTAFLAAYREELAKAYPALDDGTVLLPFPRFFLVATR